MIRSGDNLNEIFEEEQKINEDPTQEIPDKNLISHNDFRDVAEKKVMIENKIDVKSLLKAKF